MVHDVIKPIVSLETSRYLRDRMTWVALAAFLAVMLFGAIDYWNALPPRPDGSRLFTEASVLLLSLAFHASIAQDRGPHFDRFLVSNFVPADALYFAKVISAILFVIALGVIAFGVALATSLGDVAYASEQSILFLACALLLLPFVVIVELVMTMRYTVPLILALFLALMAVLHRTGDLPGFLHFMGLDNELTASRGVARTLAAMLFTVSLYPLYRRRLGLRR